MSTLHRDIDQFLTQAGLAIHNTRHTPEIAAALVTFGYDEARLQVGADLLAQAQSLQDAQAREYGEQYAATAALKQTLEAARQQYSVHRKLAKIALKPTPHEYQALGLNTAQKRSFSGWLEQANQFYNNALQSSAVQAALGQFNVTAENLQAGQALVQQVAGLNYSQEREKAEAQQATKARDAALDALNDWLADFKAVAQIALAGQPQQLEALGFGVVA